MKHRAAVFPAQLALALVLSFAGGVLLTVALGGGLGLFDRGPTDQDVAEARQRGREEARAEVDLGKAELAAQNEELGFERGLEAQEWLSLDRLPNPDGWFAGVRAGRSERQALADQAYENGLADGAEQGRQEALIALEFQQTDSYPR